MNNFGAAESIAEMFGSIDNVCKSNDENGKIFSKILDRFHSKAAARSESMQEKTYRINKYHEYLEGFRALINDQMKVVEGAADQHGTDARLLKELKDSLMQYTLKQSVCEFYDMAEILSKRELEIYLYTYMHKMISEYSEVIGKEMFVDWKTYFFLGVNIKKQLELNEMLMPGGTTERLHSMDMQGQFAKTVFYQRKRLNLTQAKLSEISGVDRTMIAKIERVSQPVTFETAVKLLTALDMGIAFYPFGKENRFMEAESRAVEEGCSASIDLGGTECSDNLMP